MFLSIFRPTAVDALLFGHLHALLTFKHVQPELREIVHKLPKLVQFYENMRDRYFTVKPAASGDVRG